MAMELDNSFTVPVPPEQAWGVLLDVERIAPCMPGATVDKVDGDVVNGHLKVKVGPVSLTYRGTATFIERDPDARVVVLEASGKETRGAGTASATVRASLEPDSAGTGTLVTMHTTMNVTGRPAQFGRGVMVEVGGKLVDQFAANLAQQITSEGADTTAAAGTSADGTHNTDGADTAATAQQNGADPAAPVAAPPSSSPPAKQDSINLVRLVGPSILKRVLPVAAVAAIFAVFGKRIWRLFRRSGNAEKA
ncbi:MAG TPA: SRPBCC family protein [Streptosporangiaceae bacterium]|nr:SRPBCC family protein [Streptosporangiaceae bacterium]